MSYPGFGRVCVLMVALAGFIASGLAWGDDVALGPGDVQGTEMAPKTLEEAKRQIALLKAEVARLRSAVKARKVSGERSESTNEAPPAEVQLKTYRSLRSILTAIPADMLPRRGEGWDKFAWPPVKAWLDENIVGQRFSGTAQLVSVQVSSVFNPTPERAFSVLYRFSLSPVPFMGATYNALLRDVRVYVDAPSAQRAEKLKAGSRLTIRGEIEGLTLSRPDTRQQARVVLQLKDPYCRLPGFVRPKE